MANKINSFRTKLFFFRDLPELPMNLQQIISDLQKDGWSFQVIDQRRGWVLSRKKEICIPTWVCEPKYRPGRFVQYIAHELAHTIHSKEADWQKQEMHGPEFMQIMKEICPPEYWHFELGYKPREAAKAGVSSDVSINIANETRS